MLAAPLDADLELPRREALGLDLADPGAVERVGRLGPERLYVEVVRSPPYLLVDGERNAESRMTPARTP